MTMMRAASLAACLALGGCGTFYVDDTLKPVGPGEKVTLANPQPVQMLFDFQTKGAHNGSATDALKKNAIGVVQNSGLFATVRETPVESGVVVSLTINNVPLSDDAFAKGFMTGFTFGLVGSTVGDGYVCTVDYLPAAGGAKITKVARDAIYTSLGATGEQPQHTRKMKGIDDAVNTMVDKCLGQPLNELGKDLKAATP